MTAPILLRMRNRLRELEVALAKGDQQRAKRAAERLELAAFHCRHQIQHGQLEAARRLWGRQQEDQRMKQDPRHYPVALVPMPGGAHLAFHAFHWKDDVQAEKLGHNVLPGDGGLLGMIQAAASTPAHAPTFAVFGFDQSSVEWTELDGHPWSRLSGELCPAPWVDLGQFATLTDAVAELKEWAEISEERREGLDLNEVPPVPAEAAVE